MKIGLLEGILIVFTALLIFGTRRLSKIKSSFKEAAHEFKDKLKEDE